MSLATILALVRNGQAPQAAPAQAAAPAPAQTGALPAATASPRAGLDASAGALPPPRSGVAATPTPMPVSTPSAPATSASGGGGMGLGIGMQYGGMNQATIAKLLSTRPAMQNAMQNNPMLRNMAGLPT